MGKRKRQTKTCDGPKALAALVQKALDVAKKAKRFRAGLQGDNFYANKLVELRVDATNIFRKLATDTAGDTATMAGLIDKVFSAVVNSKERLAASRDLCFALQTSWAKSGTDGNVNSDELFPLAVITRCHRGYLDSIARQMNGCFSSGWYDAAAVMMRRLLEVSIIEAFEAKKIAERIKAPDGNYVQLSDLIRHALAEKTWTLSRNSQKFLPQLRDVGHMSAHGRYYHSTQSDIEKIRSGCRVVIEEFLRHAELL
ncbi:MAG: DUF4145 domain-containing protein [Planctomycetaceae bacterium]|nr:DUF4145 domain-containing protein [Planctomycetaceae bacterium]